MPWEPRLVECIARHGMYEAQDYRCSRIKPLNYAASETTIRGPDLGALLKTLGRSRVCRIVVLAPMLVYLDTQHIQSLSPQYVPRHRSRACLWWSISPISGLLRQVCRPRLRWTARFSDETFLRRSGYFVVCRRVPAAKSRYFHSHLPRVFLRRKFYMLLGRSEANKWWRPMSRPISGRYRRDLPGPEPRISRQLPKPPDTISWIPRFIGPLNAHTHKDPGMRPQKKQRSGAYPLQLHACPA
jgi:hypothetical protein